MDGVWVTASVLVWLGPRMGKGDDSRRWSINLKQMTLTVQSVAPLFTENGVNAGNQEEGAGLGKECVLVSQVPLLKYLYSTGCGQDGVTGESGGRIGRRKAQAQEKKMLQCQKALGANSRRLPPQMGRGGHLFYNHSHL